MQDTQDLKATPKRKRARNIPENSKVAPFRRAFEEAGLSYKAGRAAALRGDIKIIKIGRSWYIRRSEIERLLEANTHRFDPAQ